MNVKERVGGGIGEEHIPLCPGDGSIAVKPFEKAAREDIARCRQVVPATERTISIALIRTTCRLDPAL